MENKIEVIVENIEKKKFLPIPEVGQFWTKKSLADVKAGNIKIGDIYCRIEDSEGEKLIQETNSCGGSYFYSNRIDRGFIEHTLRDQTEGITILDVAIVIKN